MKVAGATLSTLIIGALLISFAMSLPHFAKVFSFVFVPLGIITLFGIVGTILSSWSVQLVMMIAFTLLCYLALTMVYCFARKRGKSFIDEIARKARSFALDSEIASRLGPWGGAKAFAIIVFAVILFPSTFAILGGLSALFASSIDVAEGSPPLAIIRVYGDTVSGKELDGTCVLYECPYQVLSISDLKGKRIGSWDIKFGQAQIDVEDAARISSF